MNFRTMPIQARKAFLGRHTVAMGEPAPRSRDRMITGGGKYKILTEGNPGRDHIEFRREALILPQWDTPPKAPDIARYLGRIRKMMLEGKFKEAAQFADLAAYQNGCPPEMTSCPTHHALDLYLEQPVEMAENYLSYVDMRTGVITTRWEENGVFTRKLLCSRADDAGFVLLDAPKGRLNVCISAGLELREPKRGWWGSNHVPSEDKGLFACMPTNPDLSFSYTDSSVVLEGVYEYNKGTFTTTVRLRVQGGSVTADESGIRIENADNALLILKCEKNTSACELLAASDAIEGSFEEIAARHAKIHGAMFDRFEINLGASEEDHLLTGKELKQAQFLSQPILPAYMEKMVDMGRFFLLCESGQFPPIYGHVNVNINHQISGGNIANLPEMMDVFFKWIEWQLPDARENARRILGTRGFFIACHPDTESGNQIHFNEYWPHHYWISSSGWCLQPFLEHYYCTGDEVFLKERMLPLYAELAQLYEDFLTEKDKNGKVIFIPSYSPENWPTNVPVMSVINATMDISVCRECLNTLLTYAPQAGYGTQEDYDRWQALMDVMPEYLLGEYGELKEWSWEGFEERYDHRHASGLYGAYPGDEFQPEQGEELYQAALKANRMRAIGNESNHGVMHRAQVAARLKDNWLVQSLMRFTLESGYVNDNLSTTHNPYREHPFPDAQGGLVSLMLESAFYSRPGFMEPLPSMPQGSFRKGKITGQVARSFADIKELSWDLDQGEICLTITSKVDQTVTLCQRKCYAGLTIGGTEYPAEKYHDLCLKAGETVTICWSSVKY